MEFPPCCLTFAADFKQFKSFNVLCSLEVQSAQP